jgi:hypothetical protein
VSKCKVFVWDRGNKDLFYLFVKELFPFPLSAVKLEQPGKKDRKAGLTGNRERP